MFTFAYTKDIVLRHIRVTHYQYRQRVCHICMNSSKSDIKDILSVFIFLFHVTALPKEHFQIEESIYRSNIKKTHPAQLPRTKKRNPEA